jgi:hypothetical protein
MDSQILKREHVGTGAKSWARFHRDLIRLPDFRVPGGMVIVDLGVCNIRDGHEWTWTNMTATLACMRVCCVPVCCDHDRKHCMEGHSAIAMGRFKSLKTELLMYCFSFNL